MATRTSRQRRQARIPGAGYLRQGVFLDDLRFLGQWVCVQEVFESERPSGLVIAQPGTRHTVFGEVLAAGDEAELEGVEPGRRVVFQEWQGGRWQFPARGGQEQRVLIMTVDDVLALVESGDA